MTPAVGSHGGEPGGSEPGGSEPDPAPGSAGSSDGPFGVVPGDDPLAGRPGGRSRRPVLVLGEALIDLVPRTAAGERSTIAMDAIPGGSPANVAVGLARLEIPVAFAGRFASHGLGPWRRDLLAREGVDLSPSVTATEPTTLALVSLDAQHAAAYDFYGPHTADWHWRPAELPPPKAVRAAAVHTGSLATVFPPGAELLAAWTAAIRARGDVLVCYDPNVRRGIVADLIQYRQLTADSVRHAHLVKASEEDLAMLSPGVTAAAAAKEWLARPDGPLLIVVTRGSGGCLALHRDGRRIERPAASTRVVDTVGAGDAFTAGFLAHLWTADALTPAALADVTDAMLAAALDQASLVAALTCARAGADPPHAAELRDAGRIAPVRRRGR